MSVLHTRTTVM